MNEILDLLCRVDPFSQLDAKDMAALAERAEVVGAANTLKRSGGGWEAANTDVEGFLAPLAAVYGELRGSRVSVLGAGGSARAGLARLGLHLLFNTSGQT